MIDAPHDMVISIGDQNIAVAIDRDPLWAVERSLKSGTAVACISGLPVSGDGGDHACTIDAAQTMIEGIGDQEIAFFIESQIVRSKEPGRPRRPAVAAESAFTGSGDHRQTASPIEFHDAMHPRVGDPQFAFAIDRETVGIEKLTSGKCSRRERETRK
jgi:hypothetical protein